MALHVLALAVELHLPDSASLKAKRSVVTSLVETCRRRFAVAAAETGRHEAWQRAELGFVAVAGTAAHCTDVIDRVERFVWSVPEAEVVEMERHWLEVDR